MYLYYTIKDGQVILCHLRWVKIIKIWITLLFWSFFLAKLSYKEYRHLKIES